MRQSLQKASILLLVTIMVTLAGCAGSGGSAAIQPGTVGNPYPETELNEAQTRDLGSVRITYRQYANASVVGEHSKARSSDTKEVLVNESHADYDGASNEKLKRSEYYISDSVMLQVLNAIEGQGFFNRDKSGVERVPAGTTIEAYARRRSGIFKWISVEYHGETYLITRTAAQQISSQDLSKVETFYNCELIILRSSNNKRLKASVREVSREDLERTRNELGTPRR